VRTTGFIVIASAGACLSVNAAAAPAVPKGLVLEQRTTHAIRAMIGMVRQDDTRTVYLAPAGVRIGAVGPAAAGRRARGGRTASKFSTIFRFEPDDKVIRIEVNGFKKTYVEESLAERAARNEKARKALEKRMKKMRDRPRGGGPLGGLGGLLGGGGAPPGASDSPVEARKTGDVKQIAGRRCRRYEFLQDGSKIFEGWYTEKPAPEWVKRFDLDELPGANNSALMHVRKAQGGLELESVFYLSAGGRHEVTTTRITEKTMRASTFQAPKAYRNATPGATPK
jgi:hypothetical protein